MPTASGPYAPVFLSRSITGAGATIDLSSYASMGNICIENTSVDACYFNFTDVIPTAGFGDGKKQLVQGEKVNLSGVFVRYISIVSAGTSDVEIVLFPRSGSGAVL